MKKTIVTGGAGFIGSYLCECLVNDGHKVYCVDNLVSGNLENIEHLLDKSNFHFIKCNITEAVPKIEGNIDEIYDLASPASPKDYQEIPIETALSNSVGAHNLLELAKEDRAKFLFVSTSEVYGNPPEQPQTEDYVGFSNLLSSRACYAESKRFGETLTFLFRKQYGLDAKIVRVFNTYGARMRLNDGRVIPTFICQALTGGDIPIYGDGAQTRSFCYIEDTIEGLLKMMGSRYTGPINIGNPEGKISILALAERIKNMTESLSKIIFLPGKEDDPTNRCPDISLARKVLEWNPRYKLGEGLELTIEFFRERITNKRLNKEKP